MGGGGPGGALPGGPASCRLSSRSGTNTVPDMSSKPTNRYCGGFSTNIAGKKVKQEAVGTSLNGHPGHHQTVGGIKRGLPFLEYFITLGKNSRKGFGT